MARQRRRSSTATGRHRDGTISTVRLFFFFSVVSLFFLCQHTHPPFLSHSLTLSLSLPLCRRKTSVPSVVLLINCCSIRNQCPPISALSDKSHSGVAVNVLQFIIRQTAACSTHSSEMHFSAIIYHYTTTAPSHSRVVFVSASSKPQRQYTEQY